MRLPPDFWPSLSFIVFDIFIGKKRLDVRLTLICAINTSTYPSSQTSRAAVLECQPKTSHKLYIKRVNQRNDTLIPTDTEQFHSKTQKTICTQSVSLSMVLPCILAVLVTYQYPSIQWLLCGVIVYQAVLVFC